MKTSFRVGFCVSGGGRLCRTAIRMHELLDIRPVLVVLDSGADSDFEEYCDGRELHHLRLPRNHSRSEIDRIVTQACVDADLDLLCLTFDRIIGRELVENYSGQIVNVHMGLLPAFQGLNALEKAVTSGVRFVGATIHEVTIEVDRGPIVAQCVISLEDGETAVEAGARLFELLRPMYLQVIAWYRNGRVVRDNTKNVRIREGKYGKLPISPAIELDLGPPGKGA